MVLDFVFLFFVGEELVEFGFVFVVEFFDVGLVEGEGGGYFGGCLSC